MLCLEAGLWTHTPFVREKPQDESREDAGDVERYQCEDAVVAWFAGEESRCSLFERLAWSSLGSFIVGIVVIVAIIVVVMSV